MKKLFAATILSIFTLSAYSQYWRQDVTYNIEAELDDEKKMIYGNIRINYQNDSPDSLSHIFLHLYPNAYSSEASFYDQEEVKNGNTKFYFSKEKDKGYIDSLSFLVDQKNVFYTFYKGNKDIVFIDLPQKLPPGESTEIFTNFKIKIPIFFSRMGHDENMYVISQWYPKPAVYDKDGWHPIPYASIGEFYSEFGSYNVTLKVPQNFTVACTGEIQDTSEIAYMDSIANQGINAITTEEKPTSKIYKTIHIHQDSVHDFAWSASKYFNIEKKTISLPDHDVTIRHFYLNKINNDSKKTKDITDGKYRTCTESSEQTLKYCSDKIGIYPYNKLDLVFASKADFGGMEYPTLATVNVNRWSQVDQVIKHEIIHNWFYGILANNERKEPFMDESFTSFVEYDLNSKDEADTDPKIDQYAYYVLLGRNKHYKIDRPATDYRELQYGVLVYNYGSKIIGYLHDYLGDEQFYKMMSNYFDQFKFRHVSINEFINFMNQDRKEDLKWFSYLIRNSQYPIDFKLLNNNSKRKQVKIRNKYPKSLPIVVTFKENDVTKMVWYPPFRGDTTVNYPEAMGSKTEVQINADKKIPENNFRNNRSNSNFKVYPFFTRDVTTQKRGIAIAPTLIYNYYDKLTAGLGIHNFGLGLKAFNYWVNPSFGFGSKSLVGNFYTYSRFVLYKSKSLNSIDLSLSGRSYNQRFSFNTLDRDRLNQRFYRISPEVTLNFDNNSMDDVKGSSLNIGIYHTGLENWTTDRRPDSSFYLKSTGSYRQNTYLTLAYEHHNARLFNPYNLKISSHLHKDFAKLMGEINYKVNYNYSNKGIQFRFFGGYVVASDQADKNYLLYMANDGEQDYLYKENYIGRSENQDFFSNQFFVREGGFKTTTPELANKIGRADQWLMSMNTMFDLPLGKIPLKAFFDLGTYNQAKEKLDGNPFLINSGFALESEIWGIYFPLFYSKAYKDYYTFFEEGKFVNRISFSIHIDPQELLRSVKIP